MPVTRRHIVGIGTLAILAIAGCGSSSSSTVASSSAASAKPSSSPAPISFPNVALGSTEIPGYTQIVNKPLTGSSVPGGTGLQLGFANADQSKKIEDDLFAEKTTDAAHASYTGVITTTLKAQVLSPTDTSKPAVGDEADLLVGKSANASETIAVSFRQGRYLVIMLFAGFTDKAEATALVKQQVDKIKAGGG